MKIKDIAEKAGVSTATVSNVINGNYNKVSRATVEKVRGIIEEIGYSPSATARSLASKKSRIIGVVVSNIEPLDNFFSNPHYAHLLALLEKHIREEGYYMMLRCVDECSQIVPLFSSWNVDGMIFFGTVHDDVKNIKGSVRVPAVFIDTYAEDLKVANVGIDDFKGGYLSAKYLLDKGHRRIAVAGPGLTMPGVTGQRVRGMRKAFEEAGLKVSKAQLFDTMSTYESGMLTGKCVAQSNSGFTAVAAMSDIAALGIMEGLKQAGKQVPEDVSVIGFDNLTECLYSCPKLTTVSQNTEQKAASVSKLLFDLIRGEAEGTEQIRNDVSIVARNSVRDLTK